MKRREIVPIALLALILVPPTLKLVRKEPPPPVAQLPPPPEPARTVPPATARAWFDTVRARCTSADARLATDLNPPPADAEGVGYKAACYALAGEIPTARSLLLALPEEERPDGVGPVRDVAQELSMQERHDLAGPLAELVLEFWPDDEAALYQAGFGRWVSGDRIGARAYLERFLERHPADDEWAEKAREVLRQADEF